jgi:hypothetical protein
VPIDSVTEAALVALAGLGAGVVNAFAGGGTLVAYSVLLSLGVPPVTANITCSVGLLPSYAGTASAYGPELRKARPLLPSLALTAVVGGLFGAVLLLTIPERGFELVVPPLVLMGVVLLALQPRIAAWIRSRNPAQEPRRIPIGLFVAVLACAAYGSFFGAGLGVLLLAALGAFLAVGIQTDNALKALLSFVAVGAGVIVFAFSGGVAWVAASLLVVGSFIGGRIGGAATRRLSPSILRTCIVVLGAVIAVVLAVRTY